MITELVDNVVQHTHGGGEVVLRRHGDGVRIKVTDASSAPPRVQSPDPRRTGGGV